MSNPGDRWRRAWIVPAVVLIAALGLGLARCSSREAVPGAQTFSSSTVGEDDATFTIQRPSASRVLFLKGRVTSQTARDLREQAAALKASAGANEAQWEIDDSLVVAKDGIAIADPKGALEAFLLIGPPSALRVNGEYGVELIGTAPDSDTAVVFGGAVQAALGDGDIKNSLTVVNSQPSTTSAPETTLPSTTVPETPVPETTVPETTVPETTVPETTVPVVAETTDPPPSTAAVPTTIPAESTTTVAVVADPITQEQEAAVLQKIELKGITFASSSAKLTGDSNTILDEAARVLSENPAVSVEIGGHTDNLGDATSNRALSQQRADTVKAYLANKGIAADRMTTKGYGPDQPITSNATAAGRAQNRRIEFTPA